ITRDPIFAVEAQRIFDYVMRDMTDADGGFYSAEDADSAIDPADPHEKGEGAFYIWKQSEIESEIQALAGQPAARWFCYRYGVQPDGNVANGPQNEFIGRNILFQEHSIEETADRFERPVEEVRAKVEAAEAQLLAERSKRVRPHLDDKVLTAWNGLMISAFAKGGAILDDSRYAQAARRASDFVAKRMYDAESGILLRRYRKGDAAIPGFLDDYAFFAQALLDEYETSFEFRDLALAIKLTEKQLELFEDKKHGAFFSSSDGDSSLVVRMKEDYDGAEPSGNSIAVLNLLRLAQMTSREDFRVPAEKSLRAFAERISTMPSGVPQMLVAYGFSLAKPKQVILAGGKSSPELHQFLRVLHAHFLPEAIVMLAEDAAVENMKPIDGRAAAYVCENFACKLPITDPAKLGELLQ
ncbi:MAG: thioredoxin domain-containing protein, partial [Acidobacteriota bacterium]|nr:thioredoxin domain-containing protein [Acidobacteriota bacterium]